MVECPGYVKRGFKSEEEETESVNPWKTMESAPRDGTSILAIIVDNGNESMEVIWWQTYQNGCWSSEGDFELTPTQWMPLPRWPMTSQEEKEIWDNPLIP